ncbi:hypothetical protein, partial [Streptomyces lavendulae]|uniref:hypothetical protein n=1 Tax=Streptomyces lavendulae TaxID=1914 RepID=UPI0036834461
ALKLSAAALSRSAAGEGAAGPAGLPPAVRETVEAIVGAVEAGDDFLIGRLLNQFAQIADFDALLLLRTRMHTALRATTRAPGLHRSDCVRRPPFASRVQPRPGVRLAGGGSSSGRGALGGWWIVSADVKSAFRLPRSGFPCPDRISLPGRASPAVAAARVPILRRGAVA